MAIIRWIVGRIILMLNFIFSPSGPKLSAEQKARLAQQTAHLSLYQLPACPFCVKVRRAMKRQGLTLALKNINQDETLKAELIEQGGKRTVPCLKIATPGEPVQWLYESKVIIDYLNKFAV
ncbi:MAG: glutaredoxin family protein [Thalassotalea sp.]